MVTHAVNLEAIKQLSVAERIMIVEEIWDSIPSNAEIELTETQKAELDRRVELLENNPNRGSTWDEVKQRLHAQR